MQTFDDMLSFNPYEHARRSSEPDSPVEVVSALAQVIEWEHRSILFDELYAREDTFRGMTHDSALSALADCDFRIAHARSSEDTIVMLLWRHGIVAELISEDGRMQDISLYLNARVTAPLPIYRDGYVSDSGVWVGTIPATYALKHRIEQIDASSDPQMQWSQVPIMATPQTERAILDLFVVG